MPPKLKVSNTLQKKVMEACRKYANIIGVSHYTTEVRYMNEPHQDDSRDGATYATCTVDRRYLKAVIRIYPAGLEKISQSDNELDDTISHEMAHIATQHLYDVATARYCDDGEMKDAWEALTTLIANIARK